MGLYRGWGGLEALCPLNSLDPRMHEDYAFVCLFNFSVCLYICLSVYQSVGLSFSICIGLSVCMSLFLPLSLPAYVA